jgi:hypothetical protein
MTWYPDLEQPYEFRLHEFVVVRNIEADNPSISEMRPETF